jgi:hypothetical protein
MDGAVKRSEKICLIKSRASHHRKLLSDFATVFYSRDAKERESKSQLWLAKNKFHLPITGIF